MGLPKMGRLTTSVPAELPERRPGFQSWATMDDRRILGKPVRFVIAERNQACDRQFID